MSFRPRTGRNRSGLLGNYAKEVTEPDDLPDGVTLTDGNKFHKCGMEECGHTSKGKTFTASRWYKHLVCDYCSDQMTDRKRSTLVSNTTHTDVVR